MLYGCELRGKLFFNTRKFPLLLNTAGKAARSKFGNITFRECVYVRARTIYITLKGRYREAGRDSYRHRNADTARKRAFVEVT